MSFDQSDASGWDECLPSVAGCTVQTANGPASSSRSRRPLARCLAGARHCANGSITMRGECFSLPLELLRTVTLTRTDKG